MKEPGKNRNAPTGNEPGKNRNAPQPSAAGPLSSAVPPQPLRCSASLLECFLAAAPLQTTRLPRLDHLRRRTRIPQENRTPQEKCRHLQLQSRERFRRSLACGPALIPVVRADGSPSYHQRLRRWRPDGHLRLFR
jgi:hypothetical protein